MADQPSDNAPKLGDEETCYCGRNIRFGEAWHHADDGSLRCYPNDPRDGEMRAEPDPYAGVLDG